MMTTNSLKEISLIYPWQEAVWARLQWAKNNHQLGHAFLLTGLAGLGKLTFAQSFAASLLCLSPDPMGKACGHCRSCHLLLHSVHPDWQEVRPEESQGGIKVEQVRKMIAALAETSHLGGHRVVIIEPAQRLNLATSNALLKTLEEPAEKVVLLLVSDCPELLPATLRSRTQKIVFHPVQEPLAKQWLIEQGVTTDIDLRLTLAKGAPLGALALKTESLAHYQVLVSDLLSLVRGAISAVALAEKYLKQEASELFHWLMSWMSAVTHCKMGVLPAHLAQGKELVELSQHLSLSQVFFLWDKLLEMQRVTYAKANLNLQLMLEDWFTTLFYTRLN